jgi:hypothetical protein
MNPGTSKPPIKSTVKALPKSKLLQFLLKFFRGQPKKSNTSIRTSSQNSGFETRLIEEFQG